MPLGPAPARARSRSVEVVVVVGRPLKRCVAPAAPPLLGAGPSPLPFAVQVRPGRVPELFYPNLPLAAGPLRITPRSIADECLRWTDKAVLGAPPLVTVRVEDHVEMGRVAPPGAVARPLR